MLGVDIGCHVMASRTIREWIWATGGSLALVQQRNGRVRMPARREDI